MERKRVPIAAQFLNSCKCVNYAKRVAVQFASELGLALIKIYWFHHKINQNRNRNEVNLL